MELEDRVQQFFVETMRVPVDGYTGKVLLDAGCGGGTQSIRYADLGLEVVALDLSRGVDQGRTFSPKGVSESGRLHFVQGDLLRPPLAVGSFDLIHCQGVLHHTPQPDATFRSLCSLLRTTGTLYVWVYGRRGVIASVTDGARRMTTRMSPRRLSRLCWLGAPAFQALCAGLRAVGVDKYRRSRREAAFALMDILGPKHAHAHTREEVVGWFERAGLDQTWVCNENGRGFAVCGRRQPGAGSP